MSLFIVKKSGIQYYAYKDQEKHQAKMFEILNFLKNYCEANKICYWLDSGTLLGAYRNKNFIPWDDDIDICILKNDFDRLIKGLRHHLKNNSELFLYNEQNNINSWYEYLCTNQMFYINHLGLLKHVKIDLLPVKSLKLNESNEEKILFEKASYYIKGKCLNDRKLEKMLNRGTLKDQIKEKSIYVNKYMNEINSDNCYSDKYILQKAHGNWSPLEFVKADTVFPLKNIYFNGVLFPCPCKVEKYLATEYGKNFNYLPNIKKRKPFHLGIKNLDNLEIEDNLKIISKFDNEYFYRINRLFNFWFIIWHLRYKGLFLTISFIKVKVMKKLNFFVD